MTSPSPASVWVHAPVACATALATAPLITRLDVQGGRSGAKKQEAAYPPVHQGGALGAAAVEEVEVEVLPKHFTPQQAQHGKGLAVHSSTPLVPTASAVGMAMPWAGQPLHKWAFNRALAVVGTVLGLFLVTRRSTLAVRWGALLGADVSAYTRCGLEVPAGWRCIVCPGAAWRVVPPICWLVVLAHVGAPVMGLGSGALAASAVVSLCAQPLQVLPSLVCCRALPHPPSSTHHEEMQGAIPRATAMEALERLAVIEEGIMGVQQRLSSIEERLRP